MRLASDSKELGSSQDSVHSSRDPACVGDIASNNLKDVENNDGSLHKNPVLVKVAPVAAVGSCKKAAMLPAFPFRGPQTPHSIASAPTAAAGVEDASLLENAGGADGASAAWGGVVVEGSERGDESATAAPQADETRLVIHDAIPEDTATEPAAPQRSRTNGGGASLFNASRWQRFSPDRSRRRRHSNQIGSDEDESAEGGFPRDVEDPESRAFENDPARDVEREMRRGGRRDGRHGRMRDGGEYDETGRHADRSNGEIPDSPCRDRTRGFHLLNVVVNSLIMLVLAGFWHQAIAPNANYLGVEPAFSLYDEEDNDGKCEVAGCLFPAKGERMDVGAELALRGAGECKKYVAPYSNDTLMFHEGLSCLDNPNDSSCGGHLWNFGWISQSEVETREQCATALCGGDASLYSATAARRRAELQTEGAPRIRTAMRPQVVSCMTRVNTATGPGGKKKSQDHIPGRHDWVSLTDNKFRQDFVFGVGEMTTFLKQHGEPVKSYEQCDSSYKVATDRMENSILPIWVIAIGLMQILTSACCLNVKGNWGCHSLKATGTLIASLLCYVAFSMLFDLDDENWSPNALDYVFFLSAMDAQIYYFIYGNRKLRGEGGEVAPAAPTAQRVRRDADPGPTDPDADAAAQRAAAEPAVGGRWVRNFGSPQRAREYWGRETCCCCCFRGDDARAGYNFGMRLLRVAYVGVFVAFVLSKNTEKDFMPTSAQDFWLPCACSVEKLTWNSHKNISYGAQHRAGAAESAVVPNGQCDVVNNYHECRDGMEFGDSSPACRGGWDAVLALMSISFFLPIVRGWNSEDADPRKMFFDLIADLSEVAKVLCACTRVLCASTIGCCLGARRRRRLMHGNGRAARLFGEDVRAIFQAGAPVDQAPVTALQMRELFSGNDWARTLPTFPPSDWSAERTRAFFEENGVCAICGDEEEVDLGGGAAAGGENVAVDADNEEPDNEETAAHNAEVRSFRQRMRERREKFMSDRAARNNLPALPADSQSAGNNGGAANVNNNNQTAEEEAAYNRQLVALPCGQDAQTPHVFHRECIAEWLIKSERRNGARGRTCPTCRARVDEPRAGVANPAAALAAGTQEGAAETTQEGGSGAGAGGESADAAERAAEETGSGGGSAASPQAQEQEGNNDGAAARSRRGTAARSSPQAQEQEGSPQPEEAADATVPSAIVAGAPEQATV